MRKYWMMALAMALGALLGGALLAAPASAQAEHSAASAWSANVDASIVDATTVELRGANTSVETTNLDFPVQAQHKIKFTYELLDGAVCGGGAPRVFVEIDGDYINSWDGNAEQCGIDNGDGTFTVEFSTGKNGRIGAMGVMFDQSGEYIAGSAVRVSNVFVGSTLVLFEPRSVETPSPTPTATESPTPSASPTPDATAEPSTIPSAAPSATPSAEAAPELPVTGSSLPVVLGGAAVLLGLTGGGLMLLGRRKRPTFTAGDE